MSRAILFPGQGAQYIGMGMDLAEKYPLARTILAEADDAINFSLSDIIANGQEEELTRTDVSQPAILAVSWMAYKVVDKTLNPFCFDAAAGLSLGEYTAWCAAGALDFADAMRLVRLRGQAMQEAAEAEASGMVALIGADEALAEALCAAVRGTQVLQIANLNAPGQVVISGHQAACERAVAAAAEHGIRRAMALPVAGAFHSPLMAPAAERLRAALAEVRFSEPLVPVYCNVGAEPVREAAVIPGLLEKQLTAPVRWAASLQRMARDGIQQVVELGPGKTLCGMAARTVKQLDCQHVERSEDVLALVKALQAV